MATTTFEEHSFTYGANNEKTTFYLAAGPKEGPLLIFIHGWPAIGKTWKHQLATFSSLGFRTVAPDMPGYGRSTARRVTEDYAQESINGGMLALLAHLGRDEAVWVGHDWGCGAVWSLAEQHPEKVAAVCGIALPVRALEAGFEVRKYINRDIYPEDQYPDGQWSYQRFYEENFEKATAWFDADPAAFLRAAYAPGNPEGLGKPAFTATVAQDGGWFGGIERPDAEWRKIPIENTCLDEELYGELVAAMEKTSFWGADAWYANHERNREYFLRSAKNEGYLHMPVLFVEAKFDSVCDTVTSRLAEPQRKFCTDLTEVSIDAGHWVPQEKPVELNGAIARWIVEKAVKHWPGYWYRGFVNAKP